MSAKSTTPNPIEKYLKQKPPSVLYHYTSMDALEKIASTGVIWASDIDFLNDSSEYVHAKAFIRDELTKRTAHQDEDLRKLVDSQTGQEFHELDHPCVYVSSFSKDGDSLPQWRGYCPNGLGVAIGFNPYALKVGELELPDHYDRSLRVDTNLYQCVYTEKQKLNLISVHLERYLDLARKDLQRKEQQSKAAQLLGDLIRFCCPLFKDQGFQEENEWRLTVSTYSREVPSLHFRTARSTLAPYIKINVKTNYRLDFIREVVIGPTPDRDRSYMGVKRLLNARELYRVPVKHSGIPYRMW